MAAEAQRAPRIAAHATSMAALAKAPSPLETPLAAAWATVFKDCGGSLLVTGAGERVVVRPEGDSIRLSSPNSLWNDDERRGAMKALMALLDLAGSEAIGAVFGLSQERAA